MNKKYVFLIIVCLSLFGTECGLAKDSFLNDRIDNGIYSNLLQKHVKDGVVDYKGFKEDETKLDQYLEILSKVDTKTLSHNEKFAFYINAYNAWTIKLILSGYPGVKSIKDLGSVFQSPWKKKLCRIDGKVITLNDIEHHILRPKFKDPRVHFAINCASLSCPVLISEPYAGSRLSTQLDNSAKAFINNHEKNRLEGNILYVSMIFKWFKEDFHDDIIVFFLKYADTNLKKELEANKDKIRIDYLDYDWALNGK